MANNNDNNGMDNHIPPLGSGPKKPSQENGPGRVNPQGRPQDPRQVRPQSPPAVSTETPAHPDINPAETGEGGMKRTVGRLSSILKSSPKKETPETDEECHLRLLRPALPSELVGGELPYIGGRESEMVWNAAAQACGTERVHYCYSISGKKVYYLAVPSSAMANLPDTWCPLAAALPGNSEHYDTDTIYMYEQDGSAGAMRWDPETGRMQVFLGAARTIMPRIQSMDANYVTINPDAATPVAWHNRALRQEELSRQLTKWLFLSGLIVTLLALFYWFVSFTMANIFRPNLEEAKEITQSATFELMRQASNAYQSNLSGHISRIHELSMELNSVGGRLIKYEVTTGDQVEWLAVVPRAMEGDISRLGAQTVGIDEKERGYLRIKGTR